MLYLLLEPDSDRASLRQYLSRKPAEHSLGSPERRLVPVFGTLLPPLSLSLCLVPVNRHEILLRLTMSNSHASRRVAAFSTRLAPLFRLHQVLPLCSVSSRKTCSKIHINSFSYYSISPKTLIILLPGFSAEVQVHFFFCARIDQYIVHFQLFSTLNQCMTTLAQLHRCTSSLTEVFIARKCLDLESGVVKR